MKWLVVLFLVLCAPVWAQKVSSVYSSTERKVSAVLADSEFEEDAEIDSFRHLCPGYGGYELLHHGGDLRSWIDVKFGDYVSELYGETMKAAKGGFPHKANDVVEWRGVLTEKSFTPYAIIYRISASTIGEDEQREFTKLVVIGLKDGKAEFVGAVGGKDEGEKARALADAYRAGE